MSDIYSNRSSPAIYNPSIEEIYSSMRGGSDDFGIEGYIIPRNSDLAIIKEQSVPKAKKRDLYFDIIKRSQEPSPASYSPTYEKTKKDYWTPHNGKFIKSKKRTYIDEILKVRGCIPGPADYIQEANSLSPKKSKPRFGYISQSEESGFLGNTLSLAEETLSPAHYFPDEITRHKADSLQMRRFSIPKFHSPSGLSKNNEKSSVGPGYLPSLELNQFKEGSKPKAPAVSFPKSKEPRVISQRFLPDKFIPGVGTYMNIDLAYSNHIVKQRSRSTIISKSSFNRYTEDVAKQKSWIPGPGSYYVVEKEKKKK